MGFGCFTCLRSSRYRKFSPVQPVTIGLNFLLDNAVGTRVPPACLSGKYRSLWSMKLNAGSRASSPAPIRLLG